MLLQVLLTEDSPGDARLTREAFREANSRVRLQVDGVDALAFLDKGKPVPVRSSDLIVLDLDLPRMDGKPVEPDAFEAQVSSISGFWLTQANLPQQLWTDE